MCGINGVYRFSGGGIKKELIEVMNNTMEHRGPDAEGIILKDNIGLGHRRLSIIDTTSSSNQPFVSSDGRYVLVFNGEIYNYKEIKDSLTGKYDFVTTGDTEVLLAAYINYGKNCLRLFNGMFAFAIWDNEKQELFLARDRFGIKPLYYHLSNENLIFSSSLTAILATNLVDRELSNEALVDYFRYQTVHAPATIIKTIKVLLPGNYIVSNEEETKIGEYFNPNNESISFKGSKQEALEMIRTEFSNSVKRRLVADVPFGAFLSGGIDSSIVVATMAELNSGPIKTFNVSFEEDEFSESKFAKIIAELYQTDHQEIVLSANEFKNYIPDALAKMDHPSGDGLNTYVVSKKTKEAGVKMALSGLGGDEVFAGYSVFNQIPELRQKKWLQSFPAFARRPLANFYHLTKGSVQSAKIAEILKLERFDTEYIYSFYRTLLLDDQIRKLLNTNNLPINRVFEITNASIGYGTDGWRLPDLSKISVAEFQTYMSNILLRDTDQMTMAHGLEVRVPFLDHELVNKVLGVSDRIKRPTSPKQLLVEAFSDKIPERIYNRKKMGFVLPYDVWMKNELRSICEDGLTSLANVNIIDKKELNSLWQRFLKGDKLITWSRIWALVVLGDWIKRNNVH